MASNDSLVPPAPNTSSFDFSAFRHLACYSNATYELPGDDYEQAFLARKIPEKDLLEVSITQILEEFLDQDPKKVSTTGIAKLTIQPSDVSKVYDGYGMNPMSLQNRLEGLFGELQDYACIQQFSEQKIVIQEQDADYKLPKGFLATYNEKKSRRMKVKEFFNLLHSEGKFAPLTGIENKITETHWDRMVNNPEKFNGSSPLYADGIAASVTHASKWPVDLSNLGKDSPLTNLLWPSLKRDEGYEWFVPGVHAPYTYVAGSGSFFPLHEEDQNLLSMNIHLGGFPKVWYSIRPRSVVDLRAAVGHALQEGFHPNYFHNVCEDPLRHRCFVLTPQFLDTWGIYYDVVVQRPWDIILTLPIGMHEGVNLGPCVNEAVNLCIPHWLEFGKRATKCTCRYFSTPQVEVNLLPFVAEWETVQKGKFFIAGSTFGNTEIRSMDSGFMPDSASVQVEKRHILGLKENAKNAYMFKMLKCAVESEAYDDEEKLVKTFDDLGRRVSLIETEENPQALTEREAVDEEISIAFGIDEKSMWDKSCHSVEEYRKVVKLEKLRKKKYLKKTNRTTLFDRLIGPSFQ